MLAAILGVYALTVLLTEHAFNLLFLSILLNIFLLPELLRQHSADRVDTPNDYVRFDAEMMHVGTTPIPLVKINKVALEVVDDDCYFSLPYNQISPGKCPAFVFPAHRLSKFEHHLQSHLQNIEIIR
ncbi:hypothetical protein [Alteromonas gilva]|uniref:YcxB-like protein domain-containing protein n=1 Tax=Alteromonas gilva TaxID=2987522 RepID=A0ABT5L036_9ALTE|nr:hypothetical protein [Alteromonas gilva]MDC8830390.1 hypothetical protein [Alteromonas gilva]